MAMAEYLSVCKQKTEVVRPLFLLCGEDRIRTCVGFPLPAFQAGALDHSATSPKCWCIIAKSVADAIGKTIGQHGKILPELDANGSWPQSMRELRQSVQN